MNGSWNCTPSHITAMGSITTSHYELGLTASLDIPAGWIKHRITMRAVS